MQSSKAVQIIKALSETEIKELGSFIKSPYFNTNKNLIKLFELLKQQYPELEGEKTEKEFLYKKLFGEKNYNEQIIKNLSSQLYGLCMEFLGINKYRNQNAYDLELDILSELNNKRLDNIYASRLKILEQNLEDSTHMIHPLFYHLHKIETLKSQYLLSRDKQRQAAGNVMKSGDYLLYYFITEFSRIAIDVNANIDTFNVKHEANLVYEALKEFNFAGIISYLKQHNYPYAEIINIYYHRLKAVLDVSDENYYAFKELLINNCNLLELNELASLLDSLHNMAIQRGNEGRADAHMEEFEAIKLKLNYGTIALRTGGRISLITFRNVVFISIRQGEIQWGEKFVNENIDNVNPDSRENIYNHSMGIFAYVKKDYDAAIRHLNKVELRNPYFISDAKTHLAIIYFELGYYDSCIAVMDSFRHLLSSREEFSSIFRTVNLHFINALTNMLKVKSGRKNPDTLFKIKEKLEAQKMVNHKGWLLKTLNEMTEKENG